MNVCNWECAAEWITAGTGGTQAGFVQHAAPEITTLGRKAAEFVRRAKWDRVYFAEHDL